MKNIITMILVIMYYVLLYFTLDMIFVYLIQKI